MYFQKKQMREAAVLYYEKKLTQSEIAKILGLSRQTVSKLLNDAVNEGIVEIKIHNPEITCARLENSLCLRFNIKNAIVCPVSSESEELRLLMTVKKAADYLFELIKKGNLKIAVSWGRTIEALINEFTPFISKGNTVFPLFGATDLEQACFSPNELARIFADKTGAKVKYAWFPYKPDSAEDCELFKKTSYYKSLCELWSNIDIAVVGIGNKEIIHSFGKLFGYNKKFLSVVGDVSTHFFNSDGKFTELYENTLCVSAENLKNAKETIAVACGNDKTEAIAGALRSHIVDTLITDEYTAEKVLYFADKSDF